MPEPDFDAFVAMDWGEFARGMDTIAAALAELAAAFTPSTWRPFTGAGAWVYRCATGIGFAPYDVIAWLQTCPGAFRDEFREGWDA
jgi:hypothetical protein